MRRGPSGSPGLGEKLILAAFVAALIGAAIFGGLMQNTIEQVITSAATQ